MESFIIFKNLEQFYSLFNIISCCTPSFTGADFLEWKPAQKGLYNTSAAYRVQMERKRIDLPLSNMERTVYKRLWKSWPPRKTISTTWKLLKGRLSTMENLKRRGVYFGSNGDICKLCHEEKKKTIFISSSHVN